MTDQKRPDRATEIGRKANLPVKLAGPIDPGNPEYFDRIVEPRLGDNVEYIRSLTDAQKQQFLGKAFALVFPISWPEPFGLVMIEAMACGTPVVAWGRGSVPEVVDDGTTGVVVASIEEAVSRLDEIAALDRSAVRTNFEQRFTADRMAREVVDLYNNSINAR